MFRSRPTTPLVRPTTDREAIAPLELWLLALATVGGLALRGWHAGDVALTHFDEGVYAFSGLGVADASQPARLFPDQQKFSPPLYFLLVALANVCGVSPDRSPFAVNLVVGTLSIPVLWQVARRWFGPVAAIAAAFLLALSEFHILMSRTALTDVTFALTFLVALGAVLSAIERDTLWRQVLAGALVGLAWNTKYHGWFALVIGAMVIAGRFGLQHAGNDWLRRAVRGWLVMCLVAAGCYAPWSLFIQGQPGSSTGWVSYFATMLGFNWLGNLWQQVQQQAYLEGPWSRASVPLAALAAQLVAARHGRGWSAWVLPAVGAAAALIGSAGCALALSGIALRRGWTRGLTGPLWLLGSLLVLWAVMAPIYHPYFRLILPFTIATFALGGAALDGWLVPRQHSRWPALAGIGVATVAFVALAGIWRTDPSDPWRPTPALAQAAEILDAHLPPGSRVSVLGEPALAFYLHLRGHRSFERTTLEGLDSLRVPRFVIAGVYLRRAPRLRAGFADRQDRLSLVERVPIGAPSDLRLLDDFRPDSARRWIAHPDTTYDLLLFRYSPLKGKDR